MQLQNTQSFQVHMAYLPNRPYVKHKAILNKFQKIRIIECFSDHCQNKLAIVAEKISKSLQIKQCTPK